MRGDRGGDGGGDPGHGRLPDGACAAPDGDTESEDEEEEGAQERGGAEEC